MSSFQLDKAHSSVEFTVRHMMIAKVRGRFDSFSGSFDIDEQNPANSRVEVSIDAASINTREEQRDAHLRAGDFLDVEKFPSLTFKSSSVEVTGKSSARVHGDLTIRDVTRPAVLDVEFVGQSQSPWGQTAYGFEASTRISRKEWGLVWNVALETGGWLVADEVQINIEVELIKQADTQPAAA